jgi:hypothetical protein
LEVTMKKFLDAAREHLARVRWRRVPRFAVYSLGALLLASPMLVLWLVARTCWVVGYAAEWLVDANRVWWRPLQWAYDRLEAWYEKGE